MKLPTVENNTSDCAKGVSASNRRIGVAASLGLAAMPASASPNSSDDNESLNQRPLSATWKNAGSVDWSAAAAAFGYANACRIAPATKMIELKLSNILEAVAAARLIAALSYRPWPFVQLQKGARQRTILFLE
jgi:hypothetical protein